jgi:hypothetical protein
MGVFGKKATLTIAVDRPDLCYARGDAIHVQVTLEAHKTFTVRRGWLVLCADETYVLKVEHLPKDSRGRPDYSQYRVEEQTHTDPLYRAEHEFLPQPAEIPAGLIQSFDATFPLPSNAPPTYQGKIFKVDWELLACLDVRLGSNINKEGTLYVTRPLDAKSASTPLVDTGSSHPKVCELTLELTASAYALGGKLKGQLQVMPVASFQARHIDIELRRIESVHRGSNERTSRVARQRLPCDDPFSAGKAARFSLSLDLPPEQFLPSAYGRHGRARWELIIAVKRWLRRSVRHTVTVQVCNAQLPSSAPRSPTCPQCGHPNRAVARYCRECGQVLQVDGKSR